MSEHIDHLAEARQCADRFNGEAVAHAHATIALAEQQKRTADATEALVEQQRIANKLTVALVEQIGALAQTQVQPGYPNDPMLAVFEYLTDAERKGLDL